MKKLDASADYDERLSGWLFHYSSIPLEDWRVTQFSLALFRHDNTPHEAALEIIATPAKFCSFPPRPSINWEARA